MATVNNIEKRLLPMLNCKFIKHILRSSRKRGVSGVIFCDGESYPVKYSLPVLIPSNHRKKYNKLRAVYEAAGVAKWRAKRSDWIKHMRYMHYVGLKELWDRLKVRKGLKKVLVLGCGWGWEIWALETLNPSGVFYVGLDISRKPLLYANRVAEIKGKDNVLFGVGVTDILPFKDETFDATIAIFGPLDHTERYIDAFKEISRVTKEGGFFYFTVLNRFASDWLLKVIFSPQLYFKTLRRAGERFVRVTIPTPIKTYRIITHYYDFFEIGKLLKASRFKMVKSWGIFSLLPAQFKNSRFGKKDRVLSYLEKRLAHRIPFRWLGRYVAVLAEKEVI